MPTEDEFAAFLEDPSAAGMADEPRLDRLRALLGDELVWEVPPEELEELVVHAITNEAAAVVAPVSHRARRSRPTGRVVAVAAAIAASIAVVSAIGLLNRDRGYTVDIAGTDLARRASGHVTVGEEGSGFSIELDVEGLAPAPVGYYYQGWVRGDEGGVTIGTFHARDGGEGILLWSGVDVGEYHTLNITIQEEGAGPVSSGELVMTADLSPPRD